MLSHVITRMSREAVENSLAVQRTHHLIKESRRLLAIYKPDMVMGRHLPSDQDPVTKQA
jgi:hypothetical protein